MQGYAPAAGGAGAGSWVECSLRHTTLPALNSRPPCPKHSDWQAFAKNNSISFGHSRTRFKFVLV